MNPIFETDNPLTGSIVLADITFFNILQEFPELCNSIETLLYYWRNVRFGNCICHQETYNNINKIIKAIRPEFQPFIFQKDGTCLCRRSVPVTLDEKVLHRKITGENYAASRPDDEKIINDRYNTWLHNYKLRKEMKNFLYRESLTVQRPLFEEKDSDTMKRRIRAWTEAHISHITSQAIQMHNFTESDKYQTSIRLSGTSMNGFCFDMPYKDVAKISREELCEILRRKLLEKVRGMEKLEKEIGEAKLHIHSASEEVIYCCTCEH